MLKLVAKGGGGVHLYAEWRHRDGRDMFDALRLLANFVRQLGNDVMVLGEARAEVRLTASCGSVTTMEPDEDASGLLKRADDMEIRAKNKSREYTPRVSVIAAGDGAAMVLNEV